jgi:Tol biopolymer transport system component
MFKQKRKRGLIRYSRLMPLMAALVIAAGILLARFIFLANASLNDLRLVYRSEEPHKVHVVHINDGRDEILEGDPRQARVYEQESLSPDGKWRAVWEPYDANVPNYELYLVNTETGERHLQAIYGTYDLRLSWRSDSHALAFAAGNHENSFSTLEIYVLNVETGDVTQYTENGFTDLSPSFSPAGTQIAYTSAADGIHRLYVMDLATRESRLVTAETFGWGPVWSPDGKWIAFESNHLDLGGQQGDGDIFIIAPDGTNLQRMTWNPRWDRIIGWEN